MTLTFANVLTLAIAALAIAGVVVRPMRWPEAIWAVAGAVAVVVLGLVPCRRARRDGAGARCLSLPHRHDAVVGDGAARRPVRLAGGRGGAARARLAGAIVPARLRRRHRGHRVHVERRHCGRVDAGGVRGGEEGEARAAALSVRVRLRRQCRELRAADLEPRQHRALRRAYAGVGGLAEKLHAAVDRRDRRHVSAAALAHAPRACRACRRSAGAP